MLMTEDELQELREAALLLMNDVATIERSEVVQVGLDEKTVWSDLATVPCRIAEEEQGGGQREVTQAGRIVSVGEHMVRFPYGTDVHENDRIKITVNTQSRVFEVARVIEHSYATTTTVVCSEAR